MMFMLKGLGFFFVALTLTKASERTALSELGIYNYHDRIGIPEAKKIWYVERELIRSGQRIAGGSTTTIFSVPYQAGLILTISAIRNSVCGGTVISDTRILTAAHCQNDGNNIVASITAVLGSNMLFTGGTRLTATGVVLHPGYNPWIVANDIAIILVPRISFSTMIQAVNLPSGSEINESFEGRTAVLSGFGVTSNGASVGLLQAISSVNLPVINNAECIRSYGNVIQAHHLCTSGANNRGACPGDTGGPLVVNINTRRVLIGVSSFFATSGCTNGLPSGFSRVSSFVSWIHSI